MKKKKYIQYVITSFKQELSRILSVLAIVTLGVGFLIGLVSTTPDLRQSVDSYYKEQNVSDIFIKSSVGFSDETIAILEDNISDINLSMSKSELEMDVSYNHTSLYSRVLYQPMDGLNRLELISGKKVEASDECLVLCDNHNLQTFALGDELKFDFSSTTYKVVGLVHDPNYMAKQAIFSDASSKRINALIYLESGMEDDVSDNFPTTDLCLKFDSTSDLNSFSDNYKKIITSKTAEIESFIDNSDILETNYKAILKDNIIKVIRQELIDAGYGEGLVEHLLDTDAMKERIEEETEKAYTDTIDQVSLEFHVLNREHVASMALFAADAEKVQVIANIFPVFFFLVACLITLSSFTRMVSKDQLLIGTLKAIGYSNKTIYVKYLSYGLISTILGCLLGCSMGNFVLPFVIYTVYCSLYLLPTFIFTFLPIYNFGISLLMILLVSLVIVGVVRKMVKRNAAELMQDTAPRPGKKILLERIGFIWNRLKFKTKSMFRNIFRFKKNLIMMILGVGGCSAILLTGFGMSDSLAIISEYQFKNLFQYNFIVETSDEENEFDFDAETPIFYLPSGYIDNDRTYQTTLVVGNDDLKDFVTFNSPEGNHIDFNDDSVFVSKQIADNLNIHPGSNVEFKKGTTQLNLSVTAVIENYVGNYIYVNHNIASSLSSNALMAYKDMQGIDEDDFVEHLLSKEGVTNVIYTKNTLDTYNSLLSNLSSIVFILILVSAVLAITVMYNLVDININERIKEIATLRVIGYQKKEVVLYIFREIFLMSLFGLLIGLVFGVFLHRFVIYSVASPGLIFGSRISILSYLYTALLTIVFAIVVVLIFSPKIRKINMAESLKSVD